MVEDSVVNQKLAVAMLHKLGHEVTLANHGKEALAAIEVQKFDVVLMDIQMPEMDGIETARAIRQNSCDNCSEIPIIALTAHAMKGDKELFLEAGMNDYLTKPVEIDDLQNVLKKYAAVTTLTD